MATAAELAGANPPPNTDSISFVPTLVGKPDLQSAHDFLYWEFYEQGSRQAVRFGKWKAIRQPMKTGDVQLFNLDRDIGEQDDVADQHQEIVLRAMGMMDQAHVPHPNWTIRRRR